MSITVYKGDQERDIAPNKIAQYKEMGWSPDKPAPEPKKVASTPAPKKADTTVKTSGTESK